MTPYFWVNILILLAGNLAFCTALYLIREAMDNKSHWLNSKPTDTIPTPIYHKPRRPAKPRKHKLDGYHRNQSILRTIKS